MTLDTPRSAEVENFYRQASAHAKTTDQCRMRIETELAKADDGQSRLEKSKDRIDHWTAKSGEAILTEQKIEMIKAR